MENSKFKALKEALENNEELREKTEKYCSEALVQGLDIDEYVGGLADIVAQYGLEADVADLKELLLDSYSFELDDSDLENVAGGVATDPSKPAGDAIADAPEYCRARDFTPCKTKCCFHGIIQPRKK